MTISAPSDGASFPEGTTISFSGTATDVEDGDLTAALSWSSNLDGTLGSGGSHSAVLSEGTHTVTASVTDSGGLPGSRAITVTVEAECTGGGLSESFESGAGGWTTGGLWHLAANSSCAAPGYSSPTRAMVYGQDGGCDYDTGGQTSGDLISPEIAGITAESTLSFDYFRQVENEPSFEVDTTEVAVAVAGTSTWTTVWSRDSTTASENAWTASGPISLAAWAGETVRLRFRFDSVDEIANDYVGWLVDDVEVTGDCQSGGVIFKDAFESGNLSAWSDVVGGP